MSTAPKESENKIDEEVERLRIILMAFNGMDDDEQRRVFEYLKRKYAKSWPMD